jgi:hypothetical protein
MTTEQLKSALPGTRVRHSGTAPAFAGLTWRKQEIPLSRGSWMREQPGERGQVISCDSRTLARIGVVPCDA